MNAASPLVGIVPVRATAVHPVWAEVAPSAERGGFKRSEFTDPDEMDANFLRLLFKARQIAGVPFRIVSSARDPEGSVGASLSAHKKRPCRAVDLHVANNYERACVLIAAVQVGIVRIGIYPAKDDNSGSVHLDAETHPENPSPRCWTRY